MKDRSLTIQATHVKSGKLSSNAKGICPPLLIRVGQNRLQQRRESYSYLGPQAALARDRHIVLQGFGMLRGLRGIDQFRTGVWARVATQPSKSSELYNYNCGLDVY